MHMRTVTTVATVGATAVTGVLGGLLLLVSGGLGLSAGETRQLHDGLAAAGYALALVGFALVGWSTVAQAPVWLRVIVGVGLPLLAAAVWSAVLPAVEDLFGAGDGEPGGRLVAGALVVLAAAAYAVLGRAGRRAAG